MTACSLGCEGWDTLAPALPRDPQHFGSNWVREDNVIANPYSNCGESRR